MSHPAHVFTTLESYLEYRAGTDTTDKNYERNKRRACKRWKDHIARHGNVPLITKCQICSGKEYKMDVKLGNVRVSTRAEQEERLTEVEEGKDMYNY